MPTFFRVEDEAHPHTLEWRNVKVPFICDGCKQLGFGLCYQCPHQYCDFILHEQCALHHLPFPSLPFLKRCDFQFHRKNPLGETRICDACALEIHGFLYQCSHDDVHDLHPCCTNLPLVFSLPDTDMKIHLRQEMKSKCLKCQSRKRSSSSKVRGWAYVSSDGNFCYHIACMKEAWLENWKKGYFQLDEDEDGEERRKMLVLKNLAPKEVIRGGRSSKTMKGIKWLVMFLKLVVSAIFGDSLTLAFNLFQIYQND